MTILLVGLAGYFLGLTTATAFWAVIVAAQAERHRLNREAELNRPLRGRQDFDPNIVHRHENIRDFSRRAPGG